MSPSMRREWIEMTLWLRLVRKNSKSPSMRREWIEIPIHIRRTIKYTGLPPCGGSGLKCITAGVFQSVTGLPPCGGSGLKSFDIDRKLTDAERLPPCGGSGLKSIDTV